MQKQEKSMKFLKSNPIEIFVSDDGYLVFKNYDITIILNPEQTKVLSKLLPELMDMQNQHWTGIEEE
jgi:hypothetical protein